MKDNLDPDAGEAVSDDAPDFDPELDTLMGDLRDVMLGRIRTTQKPWEKMTESEQTDLANGIDLAARDIVRRTVRLMARHQWPHVVANLSEIKIGGKNGIDIKMTAPNISLNRETLGDHLNTQVQIVMIDSDQFMAARGPVDIKPDQPDLDLGDGEGVPDPEHDHRPGEGDLE